MTIIDDDLLEGLDDASDDSLPGDPPATTPKRAPVKEEKLPKMSIREAIADAKEKLETKEAKKDVSSKLPPKKEKVEPPKEEKKPSDALRKPQATKDTEGDREQPESAEPDDSIEEKPAKVVSTSKYTAPVGWTKEAKADFDALPEHIKASVAKREEEVSKGFKEYGEKAKVLEQYETIVRNYAPDHQQIGVSAPQLVERTLQWFNAIRSPDKNYAVNSLKQLARNFNIEKELSESYGSANPETQQQVTNSENEVIARLQHELAQIKGTLQQSSAESAQARVNAWAKDKPHFEKVRHVMRSLIESGAVPNKDGWLDLDTAYDRAVKADPELYQLTLQEALEKKEAEMAETLAQKEAKRKADIERAKKANVSLKPGAPSPAQKGKEPSKRKMSVRESIMLARQEVRGT